MLDIVEFLVLAEYSGALKIFLLNIDVSSAVDSKLKEKRIKNGVQLSLGKKKQEV